MASIHREVIVDVPVDAAWARLRDVSAAAGLFAGVLSHSRLEGDIRIVVFANGHTVRERILTIDETRRRIVYSVLDGMFDGHAASMQVTGDGCGRCRFLWVSDFTPAAAAAQVEPLVDAGCVALKATLEGAPAS